MCHDKRMADGIIFTSILAKTETIVYRCNIHIFRKQKEQNVNKGQVKRVEQNMKKIFNGKFFNKRL